MALPPPNSGQWTTGLFGCFSDCSSCCLVYWCPGLVVGRLAHIIDQGATSRCSASCTFCIIQCFTGCGFLYTSGYRTRFRAKFGLPETPMNDCLTDYCFLSCSLCQQYREFKNRNIDPSLGYNAVRHLLEPPVMLVAPVQQFMGAVPVQQRNVMQAPPQQFTVPYPGQQYAAPAPSPGHHQFNQFMAR